MTKLKKAPYGYYYHVTEKNWDKRKLLKPRIPECMDCNEPDDIERICVAPTVPQCLAAIYPEGDMFVYRTLRKIRPYHCFDVKDHKITNEKWILKPTVFIKVTMLPSCITEQMGQSPRAGNLRQQRKDYNEIKKLVKPNGQVMLECLDIISAALLDNLSGYKEACNKIAKNIISKQIFDV